MLGQTLLGSRLRDLRSVLRYLRVPVSGDRLPVEQEIVLVPVELRHAQGKRIGAVQAGQGRSAIQTEPDPVALRIARPVPDLVDGLRFLQRQAIRRRSGRRPADVRGCAEPACARIVDDAVDDSIRSVAG